LKERDDPTRRKSVEVAGGRIGGAATGSGDESSRARRAWPDRGSSVLGTGGATESRWQHGPKWTVRDRIERRGSSRSGMTLLLRVDRGEASGGRSTGSMCADVGGSTGSTCGGRGSKEGVLGVVCDRRMDAGGG
jgi:hypothetical protein